MQLVPTICPHCGASLQINSSSEIVKCHHCDSSFMFKKPTNYGMIPSKNTDFTVHAGTLKKYNGTAAEVQIPDNVTHIGKEAFTNCAGLTSVSMPDSIVSIDDEAFANCNGLTKLNIPKNVSIIGKGAFRGCKRLKSINISSIIDIEEYTFYDCIGLAHVIMPNHVENIGNYAFANCHALTEITIPDSVTKIGMHAFSDCGLTSVTIPDNVDDLGAYAFYGCRNLHKIFIPDIYGEIHDNIWGNCKNLEYIDIAGKKLLAGKKLVPFDDWIKYFKDTYAWEVYHRMLNGKCKYCGGEIAGVITFKCKKCGKILNYKRNFEQIINTKFF